MLTKRSKRTRGTRPDTMRPDLRALQMVPGSNPIRGSKGALPVITIDQVSPGFCTFNDPATDCIATGTYTMVVQGIEGTPSFLWELTAGVATIVSPTLQTTDITTDSNDDVEFTVRATVTDNTGSSFVLGTFTHLHDAGIQDLITGAGEDLITGAGEQLVA